LGQWIAFAAMGAAIFWMLRAWLSLQAASITTALFVLALADTEWASGFWGSSAAVAGSALMFGVLPRLQRGPQVHLGLLLGTGVVLLALTRPLEGLAVCIIPAACTIWWLIERSEWRQRLLRVALPCMAVLALGGGFLAAHNKAVTGSATKLAYAHYEDSAPGAPPFIWQAPNEPTDELRANERLRLSIDLGSYNGMRANWAAGMWLRATSQALPYYFPHVIFALVFLVIPLAFRDKRLWLLAASAAAVGAAISVSSFFLPHYVGPALPPLLVLYAIGCGVLTRFKVKQQRVGRAAVAGLSITLAVCGVWRVFALTPLERAMTRSQYWTRQRDSIAQELKETREQHLVFVRYDSTYQSQNEWVQNSADLTSAPVLWVHDLGDSSNTKVRDYEARRKAWIVTVYGGARLPELRPYEGSHVATSR
jgi:hypothetical protein